MRKRKQRPTDGGGNWMDTYGDMVTLLLNFFVMLYAMSSLDVAKWEVYVRSIFTNRQEILEEQVSVNTPIGVEVSDPRGTPEIPEEIVRTDMDSLYLTIAEKMNEIGIDGVTISRGDDYTFIEFQDRTFFDGDSSVLTEQGKNTLEVFCDAVSPAKDLLSQVNIMAHTAQGDPEHPNNPRTDRMLSAMRAAEVCIFIQTRESIQPDKLVNISYGQFRPIDTNETREGRARNRRVEILMIDEGASVRSLNEYYEEYSSGKNADRTVVTTGQPMDTGHGFAPAEPDQDGVSASMSPLKNSAEKGPAENETPSGGAAGTMAE